MYEENGRMQTVKVIGAIGESYGYERNLVFPGRYSFTFDPHAKAYDWLVVYNDIPRGEAGTYENGYEPLACPWEHTILATNEPVPVKYYGRVNALQYRYFLTNRTFEPERHPGYVFGRGYYRWLTGRTWQEELSFVPPPKSKTLSVFCSAKHPHQAHYYERHVLVSELARRLPELEWFGWGVREVEKQSEALDAYKYTIAVESHVAPGHWTEKFADAILSECLPFYAGDPNLAELFPAESFIPIPIDDPARAFEIIRSAIDSGEYEKRLPVLREARRLLLTKYNFCEQVMDLIEQETPGTAGLKPLTRIYERHALRRRNLQALLGDMFHHILKGR